MSLEFFQNINYVLPFLAFGGLMYRIVSSWQAEWAKPDHQWHYRLLLSLLATYAFLSGIAVLAYEDSGAATFLSPIYSAQAALILLHCWKWPKPRRMRRSDA